MEPLISFPGDVSLSFAIQLSAWLSCISVLSLEQFITLCYLFTGRVYQVESETFLFLHRM